MKKAVRKPSIGQPDFVRRIRTKRQGLQAIRRLGFPQVPRFIFPANNLDQFLIRARQLTTTGKAPNGFAVVAIPSGGNYGIDRPADYPRVFEVPRKNSVLFSNLQAEAKRLVREAERLSDRKKKVTLVLSPMYASKSNEMFRVLVSGAEVVIDFTRRFRRGERLAKGKTRSFRFELKGMKRIPVGVSPTGKYAIWADRILSQCLQRDLNNVMLEGSCIGKKAEFWEVYPVRPTDAKYLNWLAMTNPKEYWKTESRVYDREGD